MDDAKPPRKVAILDLGNQGFGRRSILLQAATRALLVNMSPPANEKPEPAAPVEPAGGIKLTAVSPDHEHAPAPKRFNIVGDRCYVLHQDYETVRAHLETVLLKRIAAKLVAE